VAAQHGRKAGRRSTQIGIAEIQAITGLAKPPQRRVGAEAVGDVPVHRFMSYVEGTVWKAVEQFILDLRPGEAGANTGRQLRRGTQLFGFLDGIPHQQSSLPASIAAAVRAGIDVRQRNGREAVPRSGLAG
jgi:hypothetical protein